VFEERLCPVLTVRTWRDHEVLYKSGHPWVFRIDEPARNYAVSARVQGWWTRPRSGLACVAAGGRLADVPAGA
jgi:hypothetical protein